ncbi:MAG: hydrolase [Maricaulaceae bacterium]
MNANKALAFSLTVSDRAVLEQAAQDGEAAVPTVQDWAEINSGSWNADGLERMRAVLADAFGEVGGTGDAVDLAPSESVAPNGEKQRFAHPPAIRVRQRPDAPIQILLTGHHDTVFPPGCGFESCRWLDEDRLNGPGVADMKSGLLVMRAGLLALERSERAAEVGWTILISPDEEVGSLGSGPVLAEHARKAHLGLTYEPALADGSLAGARKGSGNFTVIVRGRSAHAGREPEKGRNAVLAAARLAQRIAELNGARPGLSCNIAKIEGGGACNVVPDLALVQFNVRLAGPDDQTVVSDHLDAVMAEIAAATECAIELTGGVTRPPKPMAPANRAVFDAVARAGATLGQSIRWSDTGGVCEGNNLWAAGCPNVDTLGVRGQFIHSADEVAFRSSFAERAQLSALILLKIAEGAIDARAIRKLVETAA